MDFKLDKESMDFLIKQAVKEVIDEKFASGELTINVEEDAFSQKKATVKYGDKQHKSIDIKEQNGGKNE